MLPEEEGHIEHGTVACAEMAAKGGEQKERVQKSVNYWYAKSLDMFGNSNSYRSERFRYWGIKRRSNQQAREEYIAEVNPLIEKAGLTVPDPLEGRLYV
jgi:ring-1,2-phenylacetyl-CoA epoxidase subunit PaaA